MQHKIAYTSRQRSPRNINQYFPAPDPHIRKDNLFESGNYKDLGFRSNYERIVAANQFANVKKISEDPQKFRQTMNSKLARRLGSLNMESQPEIPNKFDDFLRQTMSYKSLNRNPRNMIEESPGNSKQIHIKPDPRNKSRLKFRLNSQQGMKRVKSTGNLLQTSKKQYHKITEQIDRNNRIIQELKKTTKKDHNYLKNVNHKHPPTYIDLDSQMQCQPIIFRKSKNQEVLSKASPVNRQLLHSSNAHVVQLSKSTQKRQTQTMISSQASMSHVRKKNKPHYMIDQFQEGKKLGEGKFGVVYLARHKITASLFALKKIQKSTIKSHMMGDQTALEIRIQSCLTHRSILTMYGFFQDKTHLYMVLQYMGGGTLYGKLKRQTKLEENETAHIIKQIAEAVEFLHDRGIVHRDIKPQNIVISNNIYKLCDFGWAAMCNERRKTYCGTFDYVPPQILEGSQYDMTVDLWCLGVLTYELLTGKAPFYHISRKQTMKKILNVEQQNLIFPEDLSGVAIDFIESLVRKNPNQRLKANEVIEHPFIKNAELDL